MEKDKKGIVLKLLIPVLVFASLLIMHAPVEELISNVLVRPILSKIIFIGQPLSQFALVAIVVIISSFGIKKLKDKFIYSSAWLIWSSSIAIYYSIYRLFHFRWIFYDFLSFNNFHFKAFDFIYIVVGYFFVSTIKKSHNNNIINLERKSGFQVDEPINLNSGEDIHSRKRFIEQISQRILNTENKKGAFAIGIIGKWGTGKTSFMRSLEDHLEPNNAEIIQFSFNPWLIEHPKSITETFFSEFSNNLTKYTDNIESDITDYLHVIVLNKPTNIFFGFLKFIWPSFILRRGSIDSLREKINEAINEINKKIIIYIDDIDRLDKKETVEVLRLIRNSANFSNVIFIVAFDKVQIVQSLKDTFDNRFLEKIFQVEFYLPPLSSNGHL